MWRLIAIGVVIIGVVVFGFSLIDVRGDEEVSASAVFAGVGADIEGYARAIEPYDWRFPADFGPHPDFQTEWWYYTGNLADENGRRFGYQLTIFRRAIRPSAVESDSEWRSNQVYMGHFTVTDVEGGQFYENQRFSRGVAGLAGATAEPQFKIWLEDWQINARNADATLTTISASGDVVAIDLDLEQVKQPALHGDNGLSARGDQPGNASYYYSLSRLLTSGTVTINGENFTVSGTTWMDHEFNTSALNADAQGWDWFGLHLDDGREVLLGQIRSVDTTITPVFDGALIAADGTVQRLASDFFDIRATGTWRSDNTDALYPAGWELRIDTGDGEALELTLEPLLADQELHQGGIIYWEGALRISGDATGYGYAELTGYVDSIGGRF